jgi:hypothetical protein
MTEESKKILFGQTAATLTTEQELWVRVAWVVRLLAISITGNRWREADFSNANFSEAGLLEQLKQIA